MTERGAGTCGSFAFRAIHRFSRLPAECYRGRVPHALRLPGEGEEAFRERAERAAGIAKVLIEACLRNACMRRYIADPELPLITEESVRRSPTVRVEYEQAVAIGGVGEALDATKSKHWGDGPWVMPLLPDDEFFPDRITYLYRANSLYNRRFEQRKRLKELLGRRWRKLVGEAQWHPKGVFLDRLKDEQTQAIRRILAIDPGRFWRGCRGREFLALPKRLVQRTLPFDDAGTRAVEEGASGQGAATESRASPCGSPDA